MPVLLIVFRKKFEAPILAAREPWATESQKDLADKASTALSNIVNQVLTSIK